MARSRRSRRLSPWLPLLVALLLGAITFAIVTMAGAADGSEPPAEQVAIGEPTVVEHDESPRGVVVVGDHLNVFGHVRGDAVAVGGDLDVQAGAEVDGDAVSVGGNLRVHPGAVVHGDRVQVGGSLGEAMAALSGAHKEPLGPFAPNLITMVQVAASFVVSAFLLLVVPAPLQRVRTYMRRHAARSALGGLGLVFLFIPFLLALTMTVLGIPLIPVAIIVLVLVLLAGMAALGLTIGYALPFYSEDRSALGALSLGYVVLALFALIPFAGPLLIPMASFFAAGAVLMTRFGTRRDPSTGEGPPPAGSIPVHAPGLGPQS